MRSLAREQPDRGAGGAVDPSLQMDIGDAGDGEAVELGRRPGTGTSCRVTSMAAGSMMNPSPSAAAPSAPAAPMRKSATGQGRGMGGN